MARRKPRSKQNRTFEKPKKCSPAGCNLLGGLTLFQRSGLWGEKWSFFLWLLEQLLLVLMLLLLFIFVIFINVVPEFGVEVFLHGLTSVVLHSVHVVGGHHWGAMLLLLLMWMQWNRRTLSEVGGDYQVSGHVRIMVRVVFIPSVARVTPGVTSYWVHPVKWVLSHVGWCHSLLFLSPIAEPDPDYFLFQLEAIR